MATPEEADVRISWPSDNDTHFDKVPSSKCTTEEHFQDNNC